MPLNAKYSIDAAGAPINAMLMHFVANIARCSFAGPYRLVLHPVQDALLRTGLMTYSVDQLADKGNLIVNPYNRFDDVKVSLDVPPTEVWVETEERIQERRIQIRVYNLEPSFYDIKPKTKGEKE